MKSVFTKRNLVIGAVSVILLTLFISVEMSKANDRKLSEAAITASAEMNGLQNVTVALQKNSEYGWYEANINCSNFGEFTPREMLAIYKAISTPRAGNTFVTLGDVFRVRISIQSTHRAILYIKIENRYMKVPNRQRRQKIREV